ncbi:MAG: hypothetical protein WDA07_06365 [Leucobacter sp.]
MPDPQRYRLVKVPGVKGRWAVLDVVARRVAFGGKRKECEQYLQGARNQQEMFPDETEEVCRFVPG